ncbi:citryl-CoA lyase [Xanthobacter sp. 91]|uniref:citryl-CoA lyase n=1 Tax=Xanthobacter sp. 91 TaxID=1117244 RepID=UPI000497AB71|nr:citryl-CoA lyase [Xanthobacter sp. 91]
MTPSPDPGQWWRTAIIDIAPGAIRVRGYAIEDLIGAISFPQMIWLMLRGDLPNADQAALLGAVLVAAVDHGPQAPSIAIARMAMTCGVGVNNAMASAVNALGDIHGGAGQQCMELYAAVDDRAGHGITLDAAAGAEIGTRLLRREHVPGFGHRFHPVDPRAGRLLSLVDDAVARGAITGRFAAIGRAVEDALATAKGKRLPMNIDGATAVVLSELGFAPEEGRGLFILSRSVGILAHAMEQKAQGGRIKGPMPPAVPYAYDGAGPRALPRTTTKAGGTMP